MFVEKIAKVTRVTKIVCVDMVSGHRPSLSWNNLVPATLHAPNSTELGLMTP